ncbi:hypothetical protein R6Q59_019210 [Mikania micrantha]
MEATAVETNAVVASDVGAGAGAGAKASVAETETAARVTIITSIKAKSPQHLLRSSPPAHRISSAVAPPLVFALPTHLTIASHLRPSPLAASSAPSPNPHHRRCLRRLHGTSPSLKVRKPRTLTVLWLRSSSRGHQEDGRLWAEVGRGAMAGGGRGGCAEVRWPVVGRGAMASGGAEMLMRW